MKKTLVSLFCVLALCLGLLPTAALADDAWSPSTILYVGDVQLSGDTVSDTEGYYIQNEGGEWEKYTGPGTPSAPFFQYNGMTLEQFLLAYIRSEFLYPRKLVYKSENLYAKCMERSSLKEVLKVE